jgi:hypothetical protein
MTKNQDHRTPSEVDLSISLLDVEMHAAALRVHDAERRAGNAGLSPAAVLWRARDLRIHAEGVEHAAVVLAREAGMTWAEIGERFGITRQAAQQRFGQTD